MIDLLKEEKKFTILFFGLLTIDILVKLYCPAFPYRYISKLPLLLLLFFYYYLNNNENNKKKHLWVNLAMLSLFLAEVLIIKSYNNMLLLASLILSLCGKMFLCFRFSHKSDFEISRLIPYSILMFVYTVGIISFLYDNLESFFAPVLLSYFITLILFKFTFLRKDVVNKISYQYVFFGVVLYIISESMVAIKIFKMDLLFQDSLIMLFRGLALYLIIIGIVKERRHKTVINSF